MFQLVSFLEIVKKHSDFVLIRFNIEFVFASPEDNRA